jgi:sulfate transport system ATP-binding protein
MSLVVENVSKRFGRFAALDGLSLTAKEGEFLALLGPSGSGKTTLLRVLAGLERPDDGAVSFQGESILGRSPRERRVGMVFQHYALFRHMTVADNVAFGLKVRPRRARPPKAEIEARVERLLSLVQLQGLGKRYPAQLSGGQRQRVALARALAIEPNLLLLDEPFGALDAKVRKELRHWLRELHREMGLTSVFVTHDQEEALDLADRVAVLNAGKIEQVGTPEEIYRDPANAFVFEFLGGVSPLPATLAEGRARFGDYEVEHADAQGRTGEAVAHVRPEDVIVSSEGPGVDGSIVDVRLAGPVGRVDVRIASDGLVEAVIDKQAAAALNVGQPVKLRPRRFRVF